MDIDILLTDEFVDFSKRIEAIHNEKRKKRQELKAFYEQIQGELKALDDEAREVVREFENWKKHRDHQVEVLTHEPESEPQPVSEK